MQKYSSAVLGASEAFLRFQEENTRLARVDKPVLIWGERGTGKENAARSLHYLSARWEKPFVPILCSALSPTLLEDALFGHEAGSFTGANSRNIGYIERAHGGTLFLDEVADIPLTTQEKLLRVLEYGTFERIGGQKTLEVDVRLVAATNKNIRLLAEQGHFRADLLDRLLFDVLYVPPLRERGDDVLLLAQHFALEMAAELGMEETDGPFFSPEAKKQLYTYPWPGNVRELRNAIERTVHKLASLDIQSLVLDPFPAELGKSAPASSFSATPVLAFAESAPAPLFSLLPDLPCDFEQSVAAYEKNLLEKALEAARYKQAEAARFLGLTYNQWRHLARKHGMEANKTASQ